MLKTDPFEILLTHDLWATRQMLGAAALLDEEKLHRQFEIGSGSVHDALTHLIGAMNAWTEALAGKEPGPRPEGMRRSVAELTEMFEKVSAEFAAVARAHPPTETITRIRRGKSYTFTRAAVLAHVATHGVHHRAQILNMLRHLGVSPLPLSSVVEWTVETGGT